MQSVFDDLKKELQLRSVVDGNLASEHMETGVLMLGECQTFDANLPSGQGLLCCMSITSQLLSCCQHRP